LPSTVGAERALGFAVMTKPQALPFLVAFGAWFLAVHGWRRTLGFAALGAITMAVLWLPFIGEGGPAGYLRSIEVHQDELFGVLSLRAWNAWWIVQEAFGGGSFLSDQSAILGPLTFRHVGYLIAGALELLVFVAVYRRPTPETLALGLAAAVLVAFSFLTTMHERYAFGALVFLALLLSDRRVLALWTVFGVVFTLNLLAAIPPTPEIGAALPVGGVLGVAGSVVIVAVTLGTLALLVRTSEGAAQLADERPPVPVQVVG
jgi:Gpi18-like mannosyltransferase